MAKYCTNCGHEFQETDKFCAECATPVGASAPVASPKQWEYCEILFDDGKNHWWLGAGYKSFFYAQGQRDDDVYTIARSAEFKSGTNSVIGGYVVIPPNFSRPYFNELVKLLTDNGWTQMQEKTGSWWWQVKFHRPAKQ